MGGVVSAVPAIVGPLLLATVIEHGPSAAARTADGTLLGLAGLCGFVAAYARTCRRHGWPVSLGAGWLVAVLLAGAAELLAGAVGRLGPITGGLLAALPALTSTLAVFTHRETGATDATEILRGTVIGMFGFGAFCLVVALTIVPYGTPAAFTLATLCALLLQALAAHPRLVAALRSAADRRSPGRLAGSLPLR